MVRARWRVSVLVAAMLLASGPALAHDKVYYVDFVKLVAESIAGKGMSAKLDKLTEEQINIMRPVQEALEAEKKSLEARIAILDPEELRNDTKLQEQLASYQARSQDFQQRYQRFLREQQLTRAHGLRNLNEAVRPVFKTVARRINTDMILDGQAILYADDAVDVTDNVVKRFDQVKTQIEVKWQTQEIAQANP